MATKLDQLKGKLQELFQLDRPDLDFGFYRVMHAKQGEIEAFLDNDLLPQVQAGLAALKTGGGEELEEAIKQAKALGVDPDTVPKVQALKAKLGEPVDLAKTEDAIYSHLYRFFSRYYDSGDFISMRRYKEGVYAIPYEGEEVVLHWANKDQYYIKSSENLRDYTVKLAEGDDAPRLHFKLVEADIEKDNRKAADDKKRLFIFSPETVEVTDKEATLGFEYRADPENRKQEAFIAAAVEYVKGHSANFGPLAAKLLARMPTDKNKDRTVLEKHLTDYTATNTMDYFIHKDLGGFLRRELDFFIKNEVMHLDDIEHDTAPRVENYLVQIKVLRSIAHKIIDFLAQLEEFQKKLWLKKKFVVESNWCITLDRVPEELYPEITKNKAQWAEWEKLGFVVPAQPAKAKKKAQAELGLGDQEVPKTETVEYLKAFPFMVLDTAFYDGAFKQKLLASIDNIDEQTDGLLIHSENFQALELLQERYREQVKCVYIDPPFNLGQNGDYLYRTDYKDSTWAALLLDRMQGGKCLLSDDGIFYLRCDYNGNFIARSLIDLIFGPEGFQYELGVQRIRKNVTEQGKISLPLANDSLFMAFKSENCELADPYLKLEKTREAYWRRIDDSAGFRNPPERVIFGKTFLPYKRDAHFKYSQKSIDAMILEERISLFCKNRTCDYKHTSGTWTKCPKCGSEDAVPKYLVQATDTKILDTNWMDVAGYSSRTGFSTENAEPLLQRALEVASFKSECVADYFAGSGTTLAVAMKNGRKWIGVEMADQFDLYIMPRLKTTAFEVSASTCFKYIRLESYEDCLNNLELARTAAQDDLLNRNPALKEDYTLRYMLDVETRGSLLNVAAFDDPFGYTLKVASGSVGESKPVTVDLVETFNYLIGLKVQTMDCIRGITVLTGENLAGEKILILWRKVAGTNSEALNDWFIKQGYNTQDMEFDIIYVNGDNYLENLRKDEQTWKVRLIEEEFQLRMFHGEGSV